MKSRKNWWTKLTTPYRLVLLNDETFEEVTSFQLTRMNVYVLVSTVLVVMVLITVSAIVFTPLKEYIPGYADVDTRQTVMELKLRADSMQRALELRERYLENIRRIISGELKPSTIYDTTLKVPLRSDVGEPARVSESEVQLRKEVEKLERFTILQQQTVALRQPARHLVHFFLPVRGGYITQPFDAARKHFGVDLVAVENEPIKAVLDGTVIFSGFTSETGYTIIVQHAQNLLSVYKHNSSLLREAGDHVRAGDIIAIIGNTGEYSTGPHLHFELWYNGMPLDPAQYLPLS
ncbi:MAG: M23 family metallopeptidase [Chitinophagales bacterium]|nr:M23 family metallopeptidase [Chitinophagales bacterium]MDW8426946.1 M23 family metallopeptidase [Chitinophagales bacterium]